MNTNTENYSKLSDAEIKKYIEYYNLFKNVVALHKNLNFGNNPSIPSVFSESLVRHLMNYSKYTGPGKKFDAELDNKYIEIKATGTKSGTTTINKESLSDDKFGFLIWIYIDFNEDKVSIKKILKDNLLSEAEADSKRRESITLSRIKYSEELVFQITETEFKKISG